MRRYNSLIGFLGIVVLAVLLSSASAKWFTGTVPSTPSSPLANGVYIISSGSVAVDGSFGWAGMSPRVQSFANSEGFGQTWTWNGAKWSNDAVAGGGGSIPATDSWMADPGGGLVTENATGDVWTIIPVTGNTYKIRSSTGLYLSMVSGALAMSATQTTWNIMPFSQLAGGTYQITSAGNAVDGGFGTAPFVRSFPTDPLAGTRQQWTWLGGRFSNVLVAGGGGSAPGPYMADNGDGTVTENAIGDGWGAILVSGDTYKLQNVRTGMWLSIVAGSLTMSTTQTVWTMTPITPTGPSGTAPPPAVAAGFSTMAAEHDFSASFYATLSNWLACDRSNPAEVKPWYLGLDGKSPIPPVCDVAQVFDGAAGANVMRFTWQPSYFAATAAGGHGMYISTTNNGQSHLTDYPYMYMEFTGRVSVKTDKGYFAMWTFSSGGAGAEYDDVEVFGLRDDIAKSGVFQWDLAGPPSYAIWDGFPGGFDVTQYHKYGMLIKRTGSTITICSYLDDAPHPSRECMNVPNVTTFQLNQRNFVIIGTGTCCGDAPTDNTSVPVSFYVKNVRIWSCAGWATGLCITP